MGSRGGLGLLGDHLVKWLSHMEGGGDWFWDLGRDFPFLGHGSCKGYCRG